MAGNLQRRHGMFMMYHSQAHRLPRWLGRGGIRVACLLLVPSILLGSVPQRVCACVNTQVLQQCHRSSCCQRTGKGTPPAGCHCSCCRQKPSVPHGCPSHQPAGAAGTTVGTPCCLQHLPAPSPRVAPERWVWTPAWAEAAPMTGMALVEAARHCVFGEAFPGAVPPPDRIIWFHHLTI